LFRSRQVEGILDEELSAYVEEQADRRIREGMDPAEARRLAVAAAGGVEQIKEGVRDERIGAALTSWLRDLRISWRGLGRRPGFTIVAVASLGLGIGANALVFSLVHTVLLEPLRYPDADRLVVVWLTPPSEPDERFGTNTGVYFTIRDNSESFERFGTGRLNESFTVIPDGEGMSEWIPAQFFSKDLVDTLGVRPMLGVPRFPIQHTPHKRRASGDRFSVQIPSSSFKGHLRWSTRTRTIPARTARRESPTPTTRASSPPRTWPANFRFL
jgi:hypothetical protein